MLVIRPTGMTSTDWHSSAYLPANLEWKFDVWAIPVLTPSPKQPLVSVTFILLFESTVGYIAALLNKHKTCYQIQ